MAGNPLVDQGTLNRLRASVLVTQSPELNVTASFLGKEMIGLTLEGNATTGIPNAAGVTQSPEPYQLATLEIHLIKAQALADQWKQRMQTNTLLGDITSVGRSKRAMALAILVSFGSVDWVNRLNTDPLM